VLPPSPTVTDGAYRSTLDRLFRRRRFGIRPGLEVVRALLRAIDDPQRSFKAIHVAGSKGKGSVAAMAAAILTAAGRRTGLFTSPHLQSYRERIQVDRTLIPRAAVTRGVARVEAAAQRLEADGTIDRSPTFFEVTTALAFDYFREAAVDAAVVEVGIGGRLDSTNVIDAPVGVITTIELEHTELLGPTLTHIAHQKAGILHRGMRAVVGEARPEARLEIERVAATEGVPLWQLGAAVRVEERTISPKGQRLTVHTPIRTVKRLDLPLFGTFQPANAALAVAATELFAATVGFELPESAIRTGLARTRWRARVEPLGRRPTLYLDVAHTPDSAVALAQSLAEVSPFESPEDNVVLFGCLADKRPTPIFEALEPLAHTIVLVPVRSERSAAVEDLRRAAVGRFRRIVLAPDAATGLQLARAATAPGGFTVVTGSDYLAGEVLTALEGGPDDEPDLSDPGRVAEDARPPAAPRAPRP
jgi:dihydrofolate synthase / folylpolyglutamate synthase